MKKFLLSVFLVLVHFVNGFSAPSATNRMVMVVIMSNNNDDTKTVETIFTSLMAAKKIQQILDIEVISSDENVQDDVFVFSLKSDIEKQLVMKMFDEEGYELAAHRIVKVDSGNNYKSLNVKTIDEGEYIFQITDESGGEYSKKIIINRE